MKLYLINNICVSTAPINGAVEVELRDMEGDNPSNYINKRITLFEGGYKVEVPSDLELMLATSKIESEKLSELSSLPLNQLIITTFTSDTAPELVVVSEGEEAWNVTLTNNIVDNTYEKLSFVRPKSSTMTQQEVVNYYTSYRRAMFEMVKSPEYSIQQNRDSAVSLSDMLSSAYKRVKSLEGTVALLEARLATLEGGKVT